MHSFNQAGSQRRKCDYCNNTNLYVEIHYYPGSLFTVHCIQYHDTVSVYNKSTVAMNNLNLEVFNELTNHMSLFSLKLCRTLDKTQSRHNQT